VGVVSFMATTAGITILNLLWVTLVAYFKNINELLEEQSN